MAIKGKGKPKQRAAAKAPRRAPVAPPVPFARRRWVQLTVVFLLGLGVFWLGVWVTNGLREEAARKDEDAQRQEQVTAMQRWKAQIESQIGPIAAIQDPLPPVLGSDTKSAAASIAQGKKAGPAASALTAQAASFTKAADALEKFDLSGAISGKGFGTGANTILVSKTQVVEALRLYASATSLTVAAIDAPTSEAKAMATEATAVLASADTLLTDSWRGYQLVLGDVGLATPGL